MWVIFTAEVADSAEEMSRAGSRWLSLHENTACLDFPGQRMFIAELLGPEADDFEARIESRRQGGQAHPVL